MKLVFIRHGDPDYNHDGLTEVGTREAQLLNARMKKMKIDKCFVSPLGRAKETARLGLEGTGIVPVEYEWLKEFPVRINRPDRGEEKSFVCWDWLPKDWTAREEFFDPDRWADEPVMAADNVRAEYDRVCACFDKLLAENGLTCVLLSHLINASPMVLWHGVCMTPSSVTVAVTEERREGDAYFRTTMIGDTSHLYAAGQEPSFSARFCECWKNTEERHD